MTDIRPFILPSIKCNPENYFTMIDWENSFVTEPPFTKSLSNEDLLQCIDQQMEVPNYPCHNQAVERNVKLVTEASLSVAGEEARHGMVLSTITSRKNMPVFDAKQDYHYQVRTLS